MQVVAVSGTTVTVIRGVGGTAASAHASGALVFVVPGNDQTGDNARYNLVLPQVPALEPTNCICRTFNGRQVSFRTV